MKLIDNIASILQEAAQSFPGQTALTTTYGEQVNYLKFNEQVNKTSALISKEGISFGDRVGILAPKSIETVNFIFASLLAGAAYVPMDCRVPVTRNTFIAKDSSVQALFIHNSFLNQFKEAGGLQAPHKIIQLDKECTLIFFKEKKLRHKEPLAYILYTSGSTGHPKGVAHTHSSALAFIKWGIKTFKVSHSDILASHAPFHFDLSVFDIFVSISAGATLLLIDEATAVNPMLLADLLSKRKVSLFYSTPSLLSYMAVYGKMYKYNYESLRCILFAGEVFPINNLRKLKEVLPKTEFYNLYGPTETNVCTWYKIPTQIPEHRKDPFPIGNVCPYAESALVISEGCRGNERELWLAGQSLMSGYWNDKEKNEKAFETDINGTLWYRTGDIVTVTLDNNLQYVGRKDRMVKRNSYRIELDEIEKHLSACRHILEGAVTVSEKSLTQTKITAHVVWNRELEFTVPDLVNYCKEVMPFYMIPDGFEVYDSLPKTSTGKINYEILKLK